MVDDFHGDAARLKSQVHITEAQMFDRLASHLAERKNSPFDFAVIDEAQDISPSQLKFIAALSGDLPNSLFFAGDLRQRIFQEAFSWKSVGVDVEIVHTRYKLITAHLIKFENKLTDCSPLN